MIYGIKVEADGLIENLEKLENGFEIADIATRKLIGVIGVHEAKSALKSQIVRKAESKGELASRITYSLGGNWVGIGNIYILPLYWAAIEYGLSFVGRVVFGQFKSGKWDSKLAGSDVFMKGEIINKDISPYMKVGKPIKPKRYFWKAHTRIKSTINRIIKRTFNKHLRGL